MEGQAELQVIEVEVKTAQYHADGRVQRCSGRNFGIIILLYRPIQKWVSATNVRNLLTIQLGLDTSFAQNEDSFLVWVQ